MTGPWTRIALAVAALLAAPAMMLAAQRYIAATEQRLIEREAVKVAEVVAQHALATRAVYAAALADGGAIAVADPATADDFVNRVGEHSRLLGTEAYAYRWLPPLAGELPLDAFQRWAWAELGRQVARAGGLAPHWEGVWRLGTFDGRRLLRYVRPVPLPSPGCDECQAVTPSEEPFENRDERWQPAVELPLQGALEILVPVEQVEAFAAVQARGTQTLVIGTGLLGFTLVTLLAMRAARQQRGLARRYEQLAKVDVLTGLSNRLDIEDRMQERLVLARRGGDGLGVMFIDVDDFKNINDSLGHAAGDQVLQMVAERMRGVLRDDDLIARYSGDEFVVLVNRITDAAPLGAIAAKLLEAVSPVVRVMDNDIFVTLSIGIAHYPSDGKDAATLLKHADTAMYRAKENGRNGFQFFAAEMNAAVLEKLQMSSNLWHAVHRNEFLVHYQPKADAVGGRILGFEALVRWDHPEHGILPPGRFIPHAEYSGAIEPLGEWVLNAALAQLRAWSRVFDGTMAVNLSMRQLYNPALPEMVRRALQRHQVAPGRLELEVTESMVSMNPEVAARTLTELGRLGVNIALDDFGTGQSSLSYLLRFPIRTLKVDRSFCADVPKCADACAIVRAIIAMSRSLRLRVVAEGVETAEQRAFFQQEGCDELQGFLVGVPMAPGEATRYLETLERAAAQRAGNAAAATMRTASVRYELMKDP